jgi:hypothetical protein
MILCDECVLNPPFSDKIHKGESKNASYYDKKMMKERTFLLNKVPLLCNTLSVSLCVPLCPSVFPLPIQPFTFMPPHLQKLRHVIDRRDMSELAKTLKPKREFTIALRMTSFQVCVCVCVCACVYVCVCVCV